MKIETKVKDIKIKLAKVAAAAAADAAMDALLSSIRMMQEEERIQACLKQAMECARARHAAAQSFEKLQFQRRAGADNYIKRAEELGRAATQLGDSYSGKTERVVEWGDGAWAATFTSVGDRYGGTCKYRKTDAQHVVTLDPAGVPLLVESPDLVARSAADGLPLIALYPDQSAVWVRRKGKSIESVRGWVVGDKNVCYHSTESLEHAQAGYARKLKLWKNEQVFAQKRDRIERRARLIARLCGNAIATIADAKRMGYCDEGISSFQSRYGIGDTATLSELIRTGDPSAEALALSVARKISRRKELQSA